MDDTTICGGLYHVTKLPADSPLHHKGPAYGVWRQEAEVPFGYLKWSMPHDRYVYVNLSMSHFTERLMLELAGLCCDLTKRYRKQEEGA